MISGRPAAGSWLLYGLGSDAEDLPDFVVMVSAGKYGQSQPIAARQWHSGLLPSRFQGVEFRSTLAPVLDVKSPPGATTAGQRDDGSFAANWLLARRGMLDDMLVVFGTEFGRPPMAQGNGGDFRLADVHGHVVKGLIT